jgi:hydroxymethylglutaryl-CoA synthase
VPEFKHACLGGVYALKAALRYAALDGRGRQAIVMASDVAEYPRGSSGEATQGAGACSMLVEEDPALCRVDLRCFGSASAYRGADFRKPARLCRHPVPGGVTEGRLSDFPVFNGRHSADCYIDAVLHAVKDLCGRTGRDPRSLLDSAEAAFFHRPYRLKPLKALAMLRVWACCAGGEHAGDLAARCVEAGVACDEVIREMALDTDLPAPSPTDIPDAEPYPHTMKLARFMRGAPGLRDSLACKLSLGSAAMDYLGNMYTASLPVWLAAGLEEAAASGRDLSGKTLLAVGYGSGDAAEAFLLDVADGWRGPASRLGVARAMEGAASLDREQYEALHDGRRVPGLDASRRAGFRIERVGRGLGRPFQDAGIEYYVYDMNI